jgi:hypothetical protein
MSLWAEHLLKKAVTYNRFWSFLFNRIENESEVILDQGSISTLKFIH